MPEFLKNPAVKFLLTGSVLYGIWLLIYYFFIKVYTDWDYHLDLNIVWFSHQLLNMMGVNTVIEIDSDHVILMMENTINTGVWVGDECNGFKLFSIFSIFIIAFPGRIKDKLWFIPLGMIAIHLANIIRVISLLLIYESYPTSLDFNHLYTFTIFVYSIIFIFWWWWAKKYGRVSKN